ncbi:hypothetical protein GTZ97_15245 [Aquabacterium fontiphilum]|jgi:hypothetical protein|uniref:hypothetical protein n=1 Tax=Aquabacterium fontiphilum TaxID=450365 RepID=UPI00137844DD|nr:hypothetical protein [Aquabacterium fontiphilum]NBD22014.1 hypothetical protein [Aquabacterium fontiphilum]
MQFSHVRAAFFATAGLAMVQAASALTLPTNALVASSTQQFSIEAQDAFTLQGITVVGLGNTTQPAGTTYAFSFPITTITIGSGLSIEKGDARGSALEFSRVRNGQRLGFTLANFTINYAAKRVQADTTPFGGATIRQMNIYTYNVAKPLTFKYRFPLSITLNETLDELILTPEALDAFTSALQLRRFETGAITGVSFGSLTQHIAAQFRSRPVSSTLYTPAPN